MVPAAGDEAEARDKAGAGSTPEAAEPGWEGEGSSGERGRVSVGHPESTSPDIWPGIRSVPPFFLHLSPFMCCVGMRLGDTAARAAVGQLGHLLTRHRIRPFAVEDFPFSGADWSKRSDRPEGRGGAQWAPGLWVRLQLLSVHVQPGMDISQPGLLRVFAEARLDSHLGKLWSPGTWL